MPVRAYEAERRGATGDPLFRCVGRIVERRYGLLRVEVLQGDVAFLSAGLEGDPISAGAHDLTTHLEGERNVRLQCLRRSGTSREHYEGRGHDRVRGQA